jgi:hypothetical protein
MMHDERITRLHALIENAGLAPAAVSVAGHARDIAVIASHVPPSRVKPLATEIRALGFRYVTVELTDDAHD